MNKTNLTLHTLEEKIEDELWLVGKVRYFSVGECLKVPRNYDNKEECNWEFDLDTSTFRPTSSEQVVLIEVIRKFQSEYNVVVENIH